MKTFWIIALFLIVSCGQSPDKGGGADPSSSSSSNASSSVNGSAHEDIGVTAKYFELEKDLPVCDETRARELVYVKETGHFEYCDQNEWVAIDLKGAQGVAGKEGKDGKDGSNGAQGSQGVAGRDGKDAKTIGANEWVDPVTDQKWYLGRFITPADAAKDSQLCSTGSHSPSSQEMQTAAQRGLFTKLGSYFTYSGSQFTAIMYNTAESSSSWVINVMFMTDFSMNSFRITSSDTNLSSWWTTKTYVVCAVN